MYVSIGALWIEAVGFCLHLHSKKVYRNCNRVKELDCGLDIGYSDVRI